MRVRSDGTAWDRVELAAVVVFAFASAVAVIGVRPVRGPDSASYLKIDLLGRAERLWTVPLVYRPLANDAWRIVAQTTVFVLAWIFCARTVAATLERPALRRVVTVAILALGLATIDWNVAILSESLTSSLTVVLLATWLRLDRSRTAADAAAFTAVALFWIFARQLDVVVVLPVTAAVLAATVLRGRYQWWVAVALVVVTAWGLASVLIGQGDRPIQRFNSMAILVDRVVPDPNASAYFQARGLVLSGTERQFAGQFAPHATIYLSDGRLVDWVDHRFLVTYGSYLAHDPGQTAARAAHGVIGMLPPVEVGLTRLSPLTGLWRVVWGRTSLLLAGILAAAGTAATIACGRFRWTSLEVAGFVGAVLAGWWLLAVWFLSATELGRLSMPGGVLLRLALIMVLARAADGLLDPGHRRRSRSDLHESSVLSM
jgi:hypothetical protein